MKKVIIIGAGASGIICAIHLADIMKDVKITLLEKNERIGKKLLSTGNGKCNITNTTVSPESYCGEFSGAIIQKFGFEFTRSFFESIGLYIKSDSFGRCYPLSESANNCLNIFLSALAKRNIEIITGCEVKSIKKKGSSFFVGADKSYEADAVLLSFGSAASVKGYNGLDLLHNLGLNIDKPSPALCPIPSDEEFLKQLKGVRIKGTLRLDEHSESGEIQFNEKNVSGICAFNLSRYVKDSDTLHINFNSEKIENKKLISIINSKKQSASENAELLDFLFTRKLGFVILKKAGLKPSGNPGELQKKDVERLVSLINDFTLKIKKPTEFKSAQTVCGGLGSEQVNPDILEARNIKGLFFGGELLDSDAPCGGFNLQWAWSSGLCAAESIKTYLEK